MNPVVGLNFAVRYSQQVSSFFTKGEDICCHALRVTAFIPYVRD